MKILNIMLLFVWLNIQLLNAQRSLPNFSEDVIPSAPDYGLEANWSALPWRNDTPDDTPNKKFIDRQDKAVVDVFFVHPTTIDLGYGHWNANLADEKANKKVDNLPIKHQASVFNGAARVFAPRYRQANYEAFNYLGTENSQKALNLAYQDVKNAFLYYLNNWNEGRPFIIAGHSQGTFHAITLVKEVIDTTALLNQMVAAYLVGMPVQSSDFSSCQPCQNEWSTNCFISWNTVKRKSYPKYYDQYFKGAVCHNPLSWELNEYYCNSECNDGMVPKEFKKYSKEKYGAQVHNGILWVDPVKVPGIPFTKFVKNWHIGDYNLFYGNIRFNVNERVNVYLQNKNLGKWQIVHSELEVK